MGRVASTRSPAPSQAVGAASPEPPSWRRPRASRLPDNLLRLQRAAGNQAVHGWLTPTHGDRPGDPLDSSVRHEMEARFGHSFGDVRIHGDAAAARSAANERAAAYTIGSDIFFGAERFDPATPGGRHLLAHELAHVIQQRGASGPRGTTAGTEGEAEAAARTVAAGGRPRIGLAATVAIQCAPDDEAEKKAKPKSPAKESKAKAPGAKPSSSKPSPSAGKQTKPKRETRPTSDPAKAAGRAKALVDHYQGRLDPGGKGLTELFSRSANLSTPQLRRPAGGGELGTLTRFLDHGAPDGRQVTKATVVPSKQGVRSFDLFVEYTDGSTERLEVTSVTSAPAGRHTQQPTSFPGGKKSKGGLAAKTEARRPTLGDVTGAIERKAVGSGLQISARGGPGTAAGSRVVVDITVPVDVGIIEQAMKVTGPKIHRNVKTVDFVIRTHDAQKHVQKEVISYERGASGFELKSRSLARPPVGAPPVGPPPPSGKIGPKATVPRGEPLRVGRPKVKAEIPRGPRGGAKPKSGGSSGMAAVVAMLADEWLPDVLPPTEEEKQEQVKFDAIGPELQQRLDALAPDIATMEKAAPDKSVYANITIKIDRRRSDLKQGLGMRQELRDVTLMKVELSYEEVATRVPIQYPPGFTTFDSEEVTYSTRVGGKDPWEPLKQVAKAVIEETRPERIVQKVFPKPKKAPPKTPQPSEATLDKMERAVWPDMSDEDRAKRRGSSKAFVEAAQKKQAAEEARAAQKKAIRQAQEAKTQEKEPSAFAPSGATAPSRIGPGPGIGPPSSLEGKGLGQSVERWANQLVDKGKALVASGEKEGRKKFLEDEAKWRAFASNPKEYSRDLSGKEAAHIRQMLNNDYGPKLAELRDLLSD